MTELINDTMVGSFSSLASGATLTEGQSSSSSPSSNKPPQPLSTLVPPKAVSTRSSWSVRTFKRPSIASIPYFTSNLSVNSKKSSLAPSRPSTPASRDPNPITILSSSRQPSSRRTITIPSKLEDLPYQDSYLPMPHAMAAENEKLEQADSPFPTLNDLVFEKKKKVVLLLSQGLLKCGCPCHRVEDTLQHTASSLGINASFSFLPDSVLITFSHPEDDSDTQSVMVKSPQSYDTGKIGQINRTMNSLHKDEMDIDTCITRLSEIMAAPPTCGFIATCLAFSLSAFSASALLFSGSWMDAGVSGALGLIVALLFILSNHYPIYGRVFEVSSSVIVALIARALHRYCCFTSVAVSAILILLPGYAMTMAVVELSARHVTTGTIRLVYSIVYAFVLAYGLQVGSSVYSAIDPSVSDQDTCANAVSPWFYIPLFPLLSISIALSFGSSHKQWPTQTFCAAIGFCLSYFLGHIIPDSQVVGSLASFAVGLYANFALKITGEAPLVPLCVGVTLLVPGSIGVRGAYALLHQDDLGHSLFPLQMLTIALGLSTGLFAAAMIVYPSGKKRSLYISF